MSTLGDDSSFLEHSAFVHESVSRAEILHVIGDVDLGSVGRFEQAMCRAERKGRLLVVDLTECAYLGAAGFSALVRAHKRLGPNLHVAAPPNGMPARLLSLFPAHVSFLVAPKLERALRPGSAHESRR